MKPWFSALARAGAAVALVVLLWTVPVYLLIRVVHRLPVLVDAKLLIFAAQAVPFMVLILLLRVPMSQIAPEPIGRSGLRAGAWLILGTLMLSLLVSMSIVLAGGPEGIGSSLSRTLAKWVDGLPNTGVLGRLILFCVLGPIYEEFLYRGFILGFLMQRTATWFAFGVSTSLFAIGHDSWLFGALGGLAYGLVYLRFGNIWLCTLVHGAHNLVSAAAAPIVVAYLYDARILVPIEGSLLPLQLTWLIAASVCFGMFLWEVLGGLEEGPFRFMLRARPSLA